MPYSICLCENKDTTSCAANKFTNRWHNVLQKLNKTFSFPPHLPSTHLQKRILLPCSDKTRNSRRIFSFAAENDFGVESGAYKIQIGAMKWNAISFLSLSCETVSAKCIKWQYHAALYGTAKFPTKSALLECKCRYQLMASLLDVKAPLCQAFKIYPRVIYNHAWKIDRKSLLTFDFPKLS